MRFSAILMIGACLTLSACGGGSSAGSSVAAGTTPVVPMPNPTPDPEPQEDTDPDPTPETSDEDTNPPAARVLKDTYQNNFRVGAAIYANQVDTGNPNRAIIDTHFNSIGSEFEMKADFIAPQEGVYNFDRADALVDFAEANGYDIRFHALLWHESTPDYFYEGTRAEIKTRLEDYITMVVTRYRGRIKYWDVVNEVVTEDRFADSPYRLSRWNEAVGNNDYIDWAFQAARAADPDAILFINDYGSEFPEKRAQYIEIIQDLIDRNIPLDGVGHQFHLNVDTNFEDALDSIDAVDDLFAGLVNHVTEMDISVYNDPGTCWQSETNCDADYGTTLPQSVDSVQARLVKGLFDGFVARPSVEMVHFWGITDDQSWLNDSPTRRSNFPLLFDRSYEPKSWFHAITDPDYVIPE